MEWISIFSHSFAPRAMFTHPPYLCPVTLRCNESASNIWYQLDTTFKEHTCEALPPFWKLWPIIPIINAL